MTEETDELLPCPFCGGEANRITIGEDEPNNAGGDVIVCSRCQASSHVEFGRKENLVSRWNSRSLTRPAAVDAGVVGWSEIPAQIADTPGAGFLSEDEGLRQLGLLYNYREGSDERQFTRWQMLVAMQHGMSLAALASRPPAGDGVGVESLTTAIITWFENRTGFHVSRHSDDADGTILLAYSGGNWISFDAARLAEHIARHTAQADGEGVGSD